MNKIAICNYEGNLSNLVDYSNTLLFVIKNSMYKKLGILRYWTFQCACWFYPLHCTSSSSFIVHEFWAPNPPIFRPKWATYQSTSHSPSSPAAQTSLLIKSSTSRSIAIFFFDMRFQIWWTAAAQKTKLKTSKACPNQFEIWRTTI